MATNVVMAAGSPKIAEPKKASTKTSSRPVRLNSFQIRVIAYGDQYETDALSGEFINKSDVHYCAEKDAIDMVAEYLASCDECPYQYLLYKTSKELDEEGNPKSVILVSTIYGDTNTKQVVID